MKHIKLFEEHNEDENIITKIELPSSGKIIKLTTNGKRIPNEDRKPDYEGEVTYTAKVLNEDKYNDKPDLQKAHRTLYALKQLEVDGEPAIYSDSSFYGSNWYIHFTMEKE